MSRDFVTCAPEMCTSWLKKPKWDSGEDAPPSLYPPTISSYPLLSITLSASQRTSDAGVCERAQSMEHNPPTKAFQTGCETFRQDKPDNRTRRWKWRTTPMTEDLRERFRILCVYICTCPNVGEGDLTVPQASYPENPASLTQTTSYAWLASGRMNTDAIKPTLCLANTYWQAFSRSSVCDTVTGRGHEGCSLCSLQSAWLTHSPHKSWAGPLHPSMPSPCDMHVWVNDNSSSNFPLSKNPSLQ